jgi:hypothetical protein
MCKIGLKQRVFIENVTNSINKRVLKVIVHLAITEPKYIKYVLVYSS